MRGAVRIRKGGKGAVRLPRILVLIISAISHRTLRRSERHVAELSVCSAVRGPATQTRTRTHGLVFCTFRQSVPWARGMNTLYCTARRPPRGMIAIGAASAYRCYGIDTASAVFVFKLCVCGGMRPARLFLSESNRRVAT